MTSPGNESVVYVSLGSNIEPERHLRQAVRLLRLNSHVLAVSPVYRTMPQGDSQQANFLNVAVQLTTPRTPLDFKVEVIGAIEQQLGRVRDPHNKNAARTIDLDIALWNNAVLDYGAKPWHVPDPDIRRFAHVAVPLADLAPDYVHPETGTSLAALAAQLDATGMQREALNLDREMIYIVNVEGAIWHAGRYLATVRGAAETHAAGALGFVGGKVEGIAWTQEAVLEHTLRREIREEVGLEVDPITYVCSSLFTGSDLEPVVNIVFLCKYRSGTVTIDDPGEVASAEWLTPPALRDDPRTPPWTRAYLEQIETVRQRLDW